MSTYTFMHYKKIIDHDHWTLACFMQANMQLNCSLAFILLCTYKIVYTRWHTTCMGGASWESNTLRGIKVQHWVLLDCEVIHALWCCLYRFFRTPWFKDLMLKVHNCMYIPIFYFQFHAKCTMYRDLYAHFSHFGLHAHAYAGLLVSLISITMIWFPRKIY